MFVGEKKNWGNWGGGENKQVQNRLAKLPKTRRRLRRKNGFKEE